MYLEDVMRKLGEGTVTDIQKCVKDISDNRYRVRSDKYKHAVQSLLSYYTFESDGEDDITTVDLLLENDMFVENIVVTEEIIIAFAKTGIIPFPRKRK